MKTNRKITANNRRLMDLKLAPFVGVRNIGTPKEGWLKAIRNSLGLSIMQLAKKLKCRDTGVLRLERREVLGTATLDALNRAAKAMNCRLVWSVVPEDGNTSLSDIVEKRAKRLAAQMVLRVNQNMKLEAQGINSEITQKQIEDLATELIRNGDSRIWDYLEGDPK